MSTCTNIDEVPQNFAEWLLAMGCPPHNVPPVDKIAGLCRGQFYMVWRSLMERVESKDVVRNKRLQVFCDDVKRCRKRSVFNERDANIVVPEELTLWSQHSQLKEKVADAEANILTEKENLRQLMDKNSSKLSHRSLSRKRLQDTQRRQWLLHQLSEELREQRANLQETKTIADSLCAVEDGADIASKLDKCIVALSRPLPGGAPKAAVSLLSAANPAACSSLASTNTENYDEELMSTLDKCRGDVMFQQLYEQRAGLCAAISETRSDNTAVDNSVTPRSVLAHTATLHCTLALQSMKNRIHAERSRERLATTITELSSYLEGEACELLVTQCERASVAARLAALRARRGDLARGAGDFATGAQHAQGNLDPNDLHNVDKAIESKRDELKSLIGSAAVVERKTQNVKDCLVSLFNGCHDGGDGDLLGGRSSLPLESMSTLRQYYRERREKSKNKMELSMNFDVSDNCSFSDPTENGSPTFVDELELYLKKFKLEKNRKLVLESGEKIWIFETLHSSLHELYTKWHTEDVTTSLLCPSVTLRRGLRRLARDGARKAELEAMSRALHNPESKAGMRVDIEAMTAEEEKTLDKIKKRLNENLLSLQKTRKTLDTSTDHLHLWSANDMKKYISTNRVVDGNTYRAYETAYLESLACNK